MRNLIAILLILLCAGGLVSCIGNKFTASKSSVDTASIMTDEIKDGGTSVGGLNDIRFANFEEKDWLDNDYIRCLRKYLDDYLSGKIENENLEPYKENIKGKFVIGDIEPSLLGGLLIRIIFVDSPNNMFSAWVYSEVDEDREVVTGYSVRSINLEDDNSGITKSQILELNKEHPELKLW